MMSSEACSAAETGAAGAGISTRVILLAGFAAGMLVACMDILVGIARSPDSWVSASEILSPLAVTSALGFAGFIALWYGPACWISRRFRLRMAPALGGLCTFYVATFLLSSTMVGFSKTMFSGTQFLTMLVVLVTGGALAHAIYILLRTVSDKRVLLSRLRRSCQASPAILLCATALVFYFNSQRGAAGFVAAALAIAAAGFAFLLFRSPVNVAAVLAAVLFGGCIAAGATALYQRDAFYRALPAGPVSKNHRVPNVILISIDSLRADAISSYNSISPSTPHIDALASDSMSFRRAYGSAAWTLPSTVSLLTGLPSFAHQVYWMTSSLPDEIPTLADVMRAAGYRTGAVADNPVLDPRLNLFHGFEQYAHYPKQWPWWGDSLGRQVLASAAPSKFHRGDTEAVTHAAQQWLRDNQKDDFFFWVHYLDPHAPYDPPARFLPKKTPPPSIGVSFHQHVEVLAGTRMLSAEEREWVRELYLAEVRYVDEQVGILVDTLKRLDLYDDSLLIVTSDHGEEFWEHGAYQHGHSMYDEVLAVPLIIKLPGSTRRGAVAGRVSTQFVMPTILDVCGVTPKKSCHSAPSLTKLVNDDGVNGALIQSGSCYQENLDAVIFRNHKLIRRLDSHREELYDLDSDPSERRSLLETAPELAELGRRTLSEQNERLKRVRECYQATEKQAPAVGRERIQQLKSLGYLN